MRYAVVDGYRWVRVVDNESESRRWRRLDWLQQRCWVVQSVAAVARPSSSSQAVSNQQCRGVVREEQRRETQLAAGSERPDEK